jgi:AraC-like DNA-binding protein
MDALEAHLEDNAHNHASAAAAASRAAHAAAPAQCSSADLVSAFSAADELAACRDASGMLRLTIELARERLGLERVGLFMRDKACDSILLRGTWGTGAHGETTDERGLFHEVAPRDYEALLGTRQSGGLGMYSPRTPLFAAEPGRTMVIGEGWVMATPLVAGRDIVGLMYNDSAFTHRPVDDSKQGAAAVLCTMLALLYQSRRHSVAWQPLPRRSGQSALVERVLRAVNDDLPMTGERLAGELGVSSGHLARCFKREMGVSLVDYRNRMRLDKFFEVVQRRSNSINLLDAALEAGFGSYAQFHRVYRRFVGSTPRDAISGNSVPAPQALAVSGASGLGGEQG